MAGIRVHIPFVALQFRNDKGSNNNDQNLKSQGCAFTLKAQGIGVIYTQQGMRRQRHDNSFGFSKLWL